MPKSKGLTQSTATSQAASRVRAVMAGELITARTRGSWDLVTDKRLFITDVTFPAGDRRALDARAALMRMKGVRDVQINSTGYMTIVREV